MVGGKGKVRRCAQRCRLGLLLPSGGMAASACNGLFVHLAVRMGLSNLLIPSAKDERENWISLRFGPGAEA